MKGLARNRHQTVDKRLRPKLIYVKPKYEKNSKMHSLKLTFNGGSHEL